MRIAVTTVLLAGLAISGAARRLKPARGFPVLGDPGDAEFKPDTAAEWLEGRLPDPVDNLSQWEESDEGLDEDVDEEA